MYPSVFEGLAKRFSALHEAIEHSKEPSDWGVDRVMGAAGRVLFTAISTGRIDLGDIPQYLNTDPKIETIEDDLITGERDAQVVVWENRDLYWLAAVKWLALNKPGSGLERPLQIWAVNPEKHFSSADGVSSLCMRRFGAGERLWKALHSFTTLSESACHYLAGLLSSKKETVNRYEESKTVEEPPEEAEYVFKKTSDYWTVRYQGEGVGPLKHLDGMSHIAALLANPHKNVPAVDLVKKVKKITGEKPNTSIGPDETPKSDDTSARKKDIKPKEANAIMDAKYLEEVRKEREELDIELAIAQKDHDEAAEERIQGEINNIEAVIAATIGLGGESRQFIDDPERAKDSVRKAIERAKENLKPKSESLWQHLDNTINTGLTCSYKPDQQMNWQL